ncbi:MAG TPA: branched-chain amino acid ABC transporter permease [Roseiflexaceae bacterium]|nr:branched-chain amino acid ABC transporter permease [Roseiflexaceae bacterium]
MQSGTFHTTYTSDMAMRPTWPMRLRLGLALVAALIFPWLADRYWLSLADTIMIGAIGAIGLNILVGFTGQISIGHGGFLAVGAYTAGLLAEHLGLPFWLTVPLGSLATAAVGALFGIPSLRLKGLYLAIATLAAQEIIIWMITHADVIGVEESLSLPAPTLFGLDLGSNIDFNFYWIILACLIGTAIFSANLFRSRVGRAFVAIRDQDIAAQVIGVDLFRYKLLAFATSSFFAGLAGALTAHYRGIISWERFTIETSILYLSMIIIGGLGSVAGSIYGAAFIVLLPALLTNMGGSLSGVFPRINDYIPFIQQGAFGLAIVLFLILEPEGIVKLWRNVKDYFRLWPFSY